MASHSDVLVYHGPLLFATFWEVRHLLSLWCKMEKPMLVLLRFHHIPTGVFSRWVQAKSENPSWMGSQISQQSRRVWTCRPGWNPKRKGASSLKKPMCFRLQVLCCYATFNKTIAQPVESHPRISTCPLPAAQWSTVLPWWSTVCGSQPFSINPCLQFAIWRLGEAMIETKPHWNYVDMIFLFLTILLLTEENKTSTSTCSNCLNVWWCQWESMVSWCFMYLIYLVPTKFLQDKGNPLTTSPGCSCQKGPPNSSNLWNSS